MGVLKKWEKIFTDSKLNVEHTQHLSHIYDTLTFMFECQGWGGGGSIKRGKSFTDSKLNVQHPQHLSQIYDTLIFIFECWGWGVGGSIKMGKIIYQFKNECYMNLSNYKKLPKLGSQKFMNGYLGIHTDGLKCLNL